MHRGRISLRASALTSWRVFLALVLAASSAAVLGAYELQQQTRARVMDSALLSSRLVFSLVVDRNVTLWHIDRLAVSMVNEAYMNADIAVLRQRGQLSGLEVWRFRDGALVYADSHHPVHQDQMPASDLARSRHGVFMKTVSGERGISTLDVFLPYDADTNGTVDAVVEVLLPSALISDRIVASTRVLYVVAGIIALLGAVTLVFIRRRQRTQEYAARHDALTGLGNRLLLAERMDKLLGMLAPGRSASLLLLDLDGFKEVNDTLGHGAGDKLLVIVGDRLRAGCPAPMEVVRLGGDEFAVLLPDLASERTADAVAQRLVAAVRQPVVLADLSVEVDVSIGLALAPRHGSDLSTLLRCADVAMYEAKRAATGVCRFESDTDPRESQQLAILAELRQAIPAGQLRLYYQPKSDINGDVHEVEALVRWQHPERGLVFPDDFVPVAERTSLMGALTTWVIEEASKQAALWRAAGHELRIAVNVSARNLAHDDVPAMILKATRDAGLPPSALQVEVTETAVMTDPNRAVAVLSRLAVMGVEAALDDFGVGYTSLAYLSTLPVTHVKIDRRFTANLLENRVDAAVVQNVIRLTRDLGMTSVAEGVETTEIWTRLAELGCDQIQGYLLTRPLPAEAFIEWLASWRVQVRPPLAGGRMTVPG